MEVFSVDTDLVINSLFITGRITYQYALDNLIGLIDKLDIQRKIQNESFYKRLENDFQDGCITPAITIAIVSEVDHEGPLPSVNVARTFIEDNIGNAFILDGIQRLNTLKRISQRPGNFLDVNRNLYINVIICSSRDNLLYRMVTLNNGQKPMTARHQIEILASSMYNFDDYNIPIYSEKEDIPKNVRAFKKSDIINAYISFLSNTTSLDNKKIIEEKLDELVARKVIENKLSNTDIEFKDVLTLIGRFSENQFLYNWLKNGNNIIGFAVGIRTSYNLINQMEIEILVSKLELFEKAFKNMNVSKIKLSRERRRLSELYIARIQELSLQDSDELTLTLAEH
jgi:hypothetical protein